MHKSFNLGAKQRSLHTNHIEERTHRARRRHGENVFRAPQVIRFSYKGIVLLKEANIFTVDKVIHISGINPLMVQGGWSDGEQLKRNIDYMLESADAERLAEVRKENMNWYCPNCKNVTLYDKGDEGETEGSHRYIVCRCCMTDIFLSDVQEASDEIMR